MSVHCFHHSSINHLEYEAKFILKTIPTNKPTIPKVNSGSSLGIENGKLLCKTAYYEEYMENDFIVYSSKNIFRNKTSIKGTLQLKSLEKKGIIQ
jgi:hypothetical protein